MTYMTFANGIEYDMPMFLEKILEKIDEKQNIEHEPITIDDFKTILTNIRLTKEDAENIEQWFTSKGYIMRVSNRYIVLLKTSKKIEKGTA